MTDLRILDDHYKTSLRRATARCGTLMPEWVGEHNQGARELFQERHRKKNVCSQHTFVCVYDDSVFKKTTR